MERKKVFETISSTFIEKQEPILSTVFQKVQGDQSSQTVFDLYEKFIVEYQRSTDKKPVRKISFCRELLFSLVRSPDEGAKSGQLCGITFQFMDDSENLYSTNLKALKEWKQILNKKLSQSGFHKNYRPIKKIGKGSFASVYLAIRLEDDKRFAVKAFSKENCYSEQNGKEALINEVEIMRMLNHKNLMCLYQVFESDNSVYLCVELLEGGQLYDLVKTKHKFKSSDVISIMRGLFEGLEHMHAKRIMHRDLKPQNLLLRNDRNHQCVIADFGLSAWVDEPKHLYVRCGTPGYVAPEIVNVRDMSTKFEPVCDMFSVGIIFHILIIGKPPFAGKTYNEVLSQNRACNINFESFQYSRLPQVTLDLLTRLLQKNPEDRITAEEALKHEYFSKEFELISNEDEAEYTYSKKFQRNSSICNSPLMTSADPLRKKDHLRDDSLMKFRMQENVMTGKTETNGSIDSTIMFKWQQAGVPMHRQSRFARRNSKLEKIQI